MVWEKLQTSLIFPKLEANSQAEVFEKLGGELTNQGFCKDTYVQALKDREADFTTGVDVGAPFCVAIPHTDASFVDKAAISIATLTKPVKWIHMGTDDQEIQVQVVFMLAINDPNAHLDQLQAVIGIIQDASLLKAIMECDKPQEIIDLIKGKEES